MRFDITITWSKAMALVLLICATGLTYITKNITVFTFTIPFVTALILGKQLTDRKK